MQTLVTFRSPVKTSEKKQSKKSVDAKTGHNTLIADCRTSPVKDGNDTEVLKPTMRTLEKKGIISKEILTMMNEQQSSY